MTITDSGVVDSHFRWRIEFSDGSLSDYQPVLNWIYDNKIPHYLAPRAVYFRTEEDIAVFKLRWIGQ